MRSPQATARILLAHAGLRPEQTADEWDETIEEETADVPEPDMGEYLTQVAAAIATAKANLTDLQQAVKRARAEDVRHHGAGRFGDTWVTVAPDKKRTIIDKDALLGWIEQAGDELGADQTAALFNLNERNLRITALRALANRISRHRDPDASDEDHEAYVRAIEETFIHTEEDNWDLKEMPISKAPKYAQAMQPGHRTGTFANKHEEDDDDDHD